MNRQFLTLICAATASGAFIAAPARGGFVLDDFDDPAEVVSPEMEGELVETPDVGALRATRTLLIYGNQADPVARLDADVTDKSTLTGVFTELQGAGGLGRLGFSYEFADSQIDFTEMGANDAIFLDLAAKSGPNPPPLLFALVQDNDGFFEAFVDLTEISAPATIVLPFDYFHERGGGPAGTGFEAVTEIHFRIFNNSGSSGGEGWRIEFDQIRVGKAPEPTTGLALVVSLAGLLIFDRQVHSFQPNGGRNHVPSQLRSDARRVSSFHSDRGMFGR